VETVFEEMPQMGDIELTIQIKARFNYSAVAAQRLARRFVNDEISYLLRVGNPTLVAQKRLVWRVPLLLAYPHVGEVGQVGNVDVDVEDGRLFLNSEQVETIRRNALALSAGVPQNAAPGSAPTAT
jgi:hypothetical protein